MVALQSDLSWVNLHNFSKHSYGHNSVSNFLYRFVEIFSFKIWYQGKSFVVIYFYEYLGKSHISIIVRSDSTVNVLKFQTPKKKKHPRFIFSHQ